MSGPFTDTIGGVTVGNIAIFANRQGDIKNSGVPIESISSGNISSSPNGAMSPPLPNIIDSHGTIFSIIDNAGYQNGLADGGLRMDLLLYFNGYVYTYGSTIGWFVWFGAGWCHISGDPRSGGLVWNQ